MSSITDVQYISDCDGKRVGVIIPLDLWEAIESEHETAYLLGSETMKSRLIEAKSRTGGVSLEDAREKLRI